MKTSILAVASLGLALLGASSGLDTSHMRLPDDVVLGTCSAGDLDTDPPAYYRIALVPTGRVPGTARAKAEAELSFARSPFGIALTPDGRYLYDLQLAIDGMRPPASGRLVAWIATRDLDEVRKLGELDEALRVAGQVEWNKYLVFVTLETEAGARADSWSGPVVFRGMSKSGYMHTMAGHGPFMREPCATYGF